jgi:hypothetical protein
MIMVKCMACGHETTAHAQIEGHCEMCPVCQAERKRQAEKSE